MHSLVICKSVYFSHMVAAVGSNVRDPRASIKAAFSQCPHRRTEWRAVVEAPLLPSDEDNSSKRFRRRQWPWQMALQIRRPRSSFAQKILTFFSRKQVTRIRRYGTSPALKTT